MIEASDYVDLPQLPAGRQWVVVRAIKEVARGLKAKAVVGACEDAEGLCERRVQVEAGFVLARGAGEAREEAGELDALLDTACGSIYRACVSAEEGAAAAPAKAAHARKLRVACFPAGLAAVTKVSYEDEVAQLARIKAALGEADLKAAVAALALGEEVATVLNSLDDYEQAIKRQGPAVTFKDVRAARRAAHNALCQLVAHILVAYPNPESADRAALLAPLIAQVNVVRAQRRADAARTDLDPATGGERPIDPALAER